MHSFICSTCFFMMFWRVEYRIGFRHPPLSQGNSEISSSFIFNGLIFRFIITNDVFSLEFCIGIKVYFGLNTSNLSFWNFTIKIHFFLSNIKFQKAILWLLNMTNGLIFLTQHKNFLLSIELSCPLYILQKCIFLLESKEQKLLLMSMTIQGLPPSTGPLQGQSVYPAKYLRLQQLSSY